MFHIHIMGTMKYLEGYGKSEANWVMGSWFGQLKRRQRLFIVFINWPGTDSFAI